MKLGKGAGAFVGWTCSGEVYGPEAATGNEAEARAMVECLRWALATRELVASGSLAVFGDSALCIAFMQKRYRPGKAELA